MTKFALLFPGQGSQYVGMGKSLYERYPAAKQAYEEASEALGFDLAELSFHGKKEELNLTANAQPAILTASVAAFRVYMQEQQEQPAILAGHSLGEITALTCAGSIKFADAVMIVRQRGLFMQEAVGLGAGTMAAVSAIDVQYVKEACELASRDGESVVISNYNAPDQIVISGTSLGIAAAGKSLSAKGALVIPLQVSAPFHSPLMRPAANKLGDILASYTFAPMKQPVISNVTARPYSDPSEIGGMLTNQMTYPVLWVDSMRYAIEQGVTYAIELGPQAVLRNLMGRIDKSVTVFAYDKQEDVDALAAFEISAVQSAGTSVVRNDAQTAGAAADRMDKQDLGASAGGLDKVLARSLAIAVCTRNHNDDSDEYTAGVIEPYRKIMKLQLELESEGKAPSLLQAKEALAMLRSVFVTKKTPANEQEERFKQIIDETGTDAELSDIVSELLQGEGKVVHG